MSAVSREATTPLPGRPWRILASGPFRSLWAAHLLTLLGDSFSYVAMPWLVLQLTGSAWLWAPCWPCKRYPGPPS